MYALASQSDQAAPESRILGSFGHGLPREQGSSQALRPAGTAAGLLRNVTETEQTCVAEVTMKWVPLSTWHSSIFNTIHGRLRRPCPVIRTERPAMAGFAIEIPAAPTDSRPTNP
jgi:hypothetical protein